MAEEKNTNEELSDISSREKFGTLIEDRGDACIASPLMLVTSVMAFSMEGIQFSCDKLGPILAQAIKTTERPVTKEVDLLSRTIHPDIIGSASNYGSAMKDTYIDIKKEGLTSNRGRKKTVVAGTSAAISRKRPGSGEQFNTQITLHIEVVRGKLPLKPKLFETGLVNVPGITNDEECTKIADILATSLFSLYPEIRFMKNTKMITANYKFFVRNGGHIFNVSKLHEKFTALKNIEGSTELKIFKIYYSRDGTAVKIDFHTPIPGKPTQTTKVPFYKRLKINFKGCPSIFYAKKLYDFAVGFLEANRDIYIKVISPQDVNVLYEKFFDGCRLRDEYLQKRHESPIIQYVMDRLGINPNTGVTTNNDVVIKKIIMLNYDEMGGTA